MEAVMFLQRCKQQTGGVGVLSPFEAFFYMTYMASFPHLIQAICPFCLEYVNYLVSPNYRSVSAHCTYMVLLCGSLCDLRTVAVWCQCFKVPVYSCSSPPPVKLMLKIHRVAVFLWSFHSVMFHLNFCIVVLLDEWLWCGDQGVFRGSIAAPSSNR